jgi:hypothetical protein
VWRRRNVWFGSLDCVMMLLGSVWYKKESHITKTEQIRDAISTSPLLLLLLLLRRTCLEGLVFSGEEEHEWEWLRPLFVCVCVGCV